MSSVYVTVANCPKEGNRENVTNADNRLDSYWKDLHESTSPTRCSFGFWECLSEWNRTPLPTTLLPQFLTQDLDLTPSCAHTARISTGCNDPSLCLRTEYEMLCNLQQKISFWGVWERNERMRAKSTRTTSNEGPLPSRTDQTHQNPMILRSSSGHWTQHWGAPEQVCAPGKMFHYERLRKGARIRSTISTL